MEIKKENIKLKKKLLDKFVFASNQTLDTIDDYDNYEILTKAYDWNIGLIWCWSDKKEEGILFTFEVIE